MSQNIVWGIEQLRNLPPLKCNRKVLLVSDSSFPFLTINHIVEESIGDHVTFNSFEPNPLYEDVCKGVQLFKDEGCKVIVAVGGGSTIDVAKCIKLFSNINPDSDFSSEKIPDSDVPLIAIPTTAGTGSESTRFAVIYRNGSKQSISNNSIIPDYAILEPNVLSTLPLYQKKCTFLDALCQGIESWWSINSTKESIRLSSFSVKALVNSFDDYFFNNTKESAGIVMNAANIAGQAINITQTTAPHAFSYKLTSMYGIPHGHAVALCLPEIWSFMIAHGDRCTDSRGETYLSNIYNDIAQAMGCNNPKEAIESFRFILKRLDISSPKTNKSENDIDILVNSVNPIRLKNNPVVLDLIATREIYNSIVL